MIKKLLLLLCVLAAGAAAGAWYQYQNFLIEPLVFQPTKKIFALEKGWSARKLSAELVNQGVLPDKLNKLQFDVYSRQSGQALRIQAGEYQLESGLTPPELLQIFVAGQVTQYKIAIIEGWNYKRLLQALKDDDRLVQTLDGLSGEQVMEQLGGKGLHPEGQFLPDTYSFVKNTSDLEILQMSHKALKQTLAKEWSGKAKESLLNSAYEALIMASIIEKETAAAAERPRISGVFNLRLEKNMKLQTDPTVIYGMGDAYKGNIRRKDLTTDTPYNTYTRKGLPPTPIALAGRDAINAAVHPLEGKDVFFVAKGDGSGTHKFSVTVKEHNAAVRKYQLKK